MTTDKQLNIKELGQAWQFRLARDFAIEAHWSEEQREMLDKLLDSMDSKAIGAFALATAEFVTGEVGQQALAKSMAGQNSAALIASLFGHSCEVEAQQVGPFWAKHMGLVGSHYAELRRGTVLRKRRSGKFERLHVEYEGQQLGLCWDRSRTDYQSISTCLFGAGAAATQAAETWVRGDNPVPHYNLAEFLAP